MPRAQGDGQPPALQDDEPEETPEPEAPVVHQNGEADEPSENGEADEPTDLLTRTFDDHEIRTVFVGGAAYAVAKDIAEALDYRMASDFTRLVKDKYKGTQNVRTPGGEQKMTCINEPGLWQGLSRVRGNEDAERLQDWFWEEVMPTIRKTGGYQLNGHPQHSAPDALRMVADLLEEQQAQIVDLNERLEEMEDEVEEQRTLVEKNRNNGYTHRSGPALRDDFNRAVLAYAQSAGIPNRKAYNRVYSQITHNGMTVDDAARMRGISKVEMLDRDGQLKKAIKVVERLLDSLETTV